MGDSEDVRLRQILTESKTIAVVGASADTTKAANSIPTYMQRHGYDVIPVNPRGGVILGVDAVATLADVGRPIDIVNVFRPSAETPDVARQAVAAGARVLWLQLGIASEEARRIAEAAGLIVIMDACIAVEHGRLGLGPGPD